MKRTFLSIIALAVTGMAYVNAQVSGNYEYNAPTSGNYQNNNNQTTLQKTRPAATTAAIASNNEINITINGLSNILADTYVAMFNVTQVGETMESTDLLMNNRITAFKQKLKSIGIDTTEIKVDVISFVPKYEIEVSGKTFSKSFNEVPAGFEMQKNITIKYKNSAKIDQIISAAASSEIYDIVKVDYFISSIQKSLDSLRIKCLQEVNTREKEFELIGFKLDTLKKVMADDYSTIYPQSRYFAYQAFSRPSLVAAKKKTTTTSNYTEVPKVTSRFYNKFDYDEYDIVINPVVTEPVVQISYTVTVKYMLKADEKIGNIYYLLTPAGEMKQFYPK